MAKRSDFAQKLLDDLKMRKERLASSSQTSNRSNSSIAITDAYSYARQNYRGSKDIRTNDMVGSRTGIGGRSRANESGRQTLGLALGADSSSQHIVPYNTGTSQATRQMRDLSMALAFALENGGKINRTDSSPRSSMLDFLQHIGAAKSVLDPPPQQQRRGATTRLPPAFSPPQIEEISKGVQRMNQILRACSGSGSGGANFGKELLKGAMDLEKSLKILVELQEASEYAVEPPQRKSRIKIVDEEDDDDEIGSTTNVAEEWRLERPRFSFDKSTGVGRAGGGVNPRPESTPQEKARIPNVIAKLMGLEKLPEGEKYPADKSFAAPPRMKEKRVLAEANPFVVNTSFKVVKERNLSGHSVRPEAAVIIGDHKPKKAQRQPEKLSSGSHVNNKKPQNIHTETQKPLPMVKKTVLDERDRSLKHKANATSSRSIPSENKKLNKKIVRKSERSSSTGNKDANDRNLDRSFSPRVQPESEPRRARARNVDEKAVGVEKGKVVTKAQQNKRSRTLNDMITKHHNSLLIKQVKPPPTTTTTRLEKLVIEAKPDDDDDAINLNRSSEAQDLRLEKAEESSTDHLALSDGFCQNETLDGQLCEDREVKYGIDVSNGLDIGETTRHEETTYQAVVTTKPADEPILLTESENGLKQILIKSHLFLNTAEALFELDIPIATLHRYSTSTAQNDDNINNIEQRKLVLDCGYEVMRRKARRRELSVHPNYAGTRLSTPTSAIRSLEGLIRELSEDFEKLRTYGRRKGREGTVEAAAAEEYLAGMQESDVYGKVPDVNCMWDLGWNHRMFAFVEVTEVVRDVEKFVLNALLDQITVDIFFSYV